MANNPQFTQQPLRTTRRRQNGLRQMLYGIGLAVLGVILTIVAQVIAASTGSSFTIVFSGMIIIGIIYALIGLFRWITQR